MSILTINNLCHVFDDKVLFDSASLTVNNGEHAGIVGLNGAGKTTFMNIISGRVMQDSGEIKWSGGIKWGYLDQHADIDRNLTVMEYLEGSFKSLFQENERLEKMYEAMSDPSLSPEELDKLIVKSGKIVDMLTNENFFQIESDIKKVANGLGVGEFGYDTIIGNLSGGQRAKLMLSKLLLSSLDVLLLDEPTNFLDVQHIDWLGGFLEEFKGTFLLISHDTAFLNRVCKGIINIENQTIKKYTGNYDQFLQQHESNKKQYEENYLRQQREIKKMEDYIARNKARAATAGMANSRKKMLEKIDVIAKPSVIYPAVFHFPYVSVNTKDMLDVQDLAIGYEDVLVSGINFHMTSETKLWLKGINGAGKSTLIKTLMGQLKAKDGSFCFHMNAKINYLEQDLAFRSKSDTPMAFMMSEFPRFSQKDARTQLAKAGIKNDLVTRPINLLSGGEQVRVKLCAIMQIPSNILILDEPTNHLDVNAKESLKKAVTEYRGAMILVSHEPNFCDSVCNAVLDIK